MAGQGREKVPPVQGQGLQPGFQAPRRQQAGKVLRVQNQGNLRVPLTAALPAEDQGLSASRLQLVQGGAGPVEDGLQGVEGAALPPGPEQVRQLPVGHGTGPLPDQEGQQQEELAGAAAGERRLPPADGKAPKGLHAQGGRVHGDAPFRFVQVKYRREMREKASGVLRV